jgi:dephospho-CoA kinase
MRLHGNDFEKAFGEPPRYDHDGDLDLNYLTTHDGRVAIALEIIRSTVDNGIDEMIEKLVQSNRIITVIDWSVLPVLKTWEQCEKKVVVSANFELRVDRLVHREIKGFDEQYYRNLASGLPIYTNITHDLLIQNDESLSSFDKTIEKISKNILEEIRNG